MIDRAILDKVLPELDLEDLRDEAVEELKENGFIITNFQPGGVFYTLLMTVLKIRAEIRRLARSVLDSMFVSHASGAWLDLKAADYSKKRRAAQKTRGRLTVTRAEGAAGLLRVEQGSVFRTAPDVNGEELRFFAVRAAEASAEKEALTVEVEAEKPGSRYNVPAGQITRPLVWIAGAAGVTNGQDWIIREGSDEEDDESLRARCLRSWSELAARAVEDTFVNAAESVPGVLSARADCDHPRGQGTVDVVVAGAAGEASEDLLEAVRQAVDRIAGPCDDVLVRSAKALPVNVTLTVTAPVGGLTDEDIRAQITAALAARFGLWGLREIRLSDVNFAVRSGCPSLTNAAISEPAADKEAGKEQVLTLGAVSVTVERE